LKQEWQKSPAGTRQTDGKNMHGEIERKLAKLSKTTVLLLTVIPLNYLMILGKAGLHK
jgi:hypothetical protein